MRRGPLFGAITAVCNVRSGDHWRLASENCSYSQVVVNHTSLPTHRSRAFSVPFCLACRVVGSATMNSQHRSISYISNTRTLLASTSQSSSNANIKSKKSTIPSLESKIIKMIKSEGDIIGAVELLCGRQLKLDERGTALPVAGSSPTNNGGITCASAASLVLHACLEKLTRLTEGSSAAEGLEAADSSNVNRDGSSVDYSCADSDLEIFMKATQRLVQTLQHSSPSLKWNSKLATLLLRFQCFNHVHNRNQLLKRVLRMSSSCVLNIADEEPPLDLEHLVSLCGGGSAVVGRWSEQRGGSGVINGSPSLPFAEAMQTFHWLRGQNEGLRHRSLSPLLRATCADIVLCCELSERLGLILNSTQTSPSLSPSSTICSTTDTQRQQQQHAPFLFENDPSFTYLRREVVVPHLLSLVRSLITICESDNIGLDEGDYASIFKAFGRASADVCFKLDYSRDETRIRKVDGRDPNGTSTSGDNGTVHSESDAFHSESHMKEGADNSIRHHHRDSTIIGSSMSDCCVKTVLSPNKVPITHLHHILISMQRHVELVRDASTISALRSWTETATSAAARSAAAAGLLKESELIPVQPLSFLQSSPPTNSPMSKNKANDTLPTSAHHRVPPARPSSCGCCGAVLVGHPYPTAVRQQLLGSIEEIVVSSAERKAEARLAARRLQEEAERKVAGASLRKDSHNVSDTGSENHHRRHQQKSNTPPSLKGQQSRNTFKAFARLIESCADANVYIDAANVGYFGLRGWYAEAKCRRTAFNNPTWSSQQIEEYAAKHPEEFTIDHTKPFVDVPPSFELIDLVLTELTTNPTYEHYAFRPLIFIHKRHTEVGNILPSDRMIFEKWLSNKSVLVTPDGVNDDLCWLYGCFYHTQTTDTLGSGAASGQRLVYVVTTDLMRDHIFKLFDQQGIRHFRDRARMGFSCSYDENVKETKIFFEFPSPFANCIQYDAGKCSWHIPYEVTDSSSRLALLDGEEKGCVSSVDNASEVRWLCLS